jgi:hypothetical protein
MKKTIALILVIALLSGCQFGLFQSKQTMRLPEVKVGVLGVELSATSGSPPPEVYENSRFTMLTVLSNLGASDVEDGAFSVSFEPQYVYLARTQAQGRFAVRGKSEFNPQGQEKLISLQFDTKPLDPNIQGYTTTIAFNLCYPYQTNAPITVCIDTDLTGKMPNKVCTPKPQVMMGGQGAPVAVAMIEPRMLPSDIPGRTIPEFVLTLKNLGKGEVLQKDKYIDACFGQSLGEGGWNVVDVSAALSEVLLKCTPETIKLKTQGDTKVVCRLEEGIDDRLGTYTAPLAVTVDYGYMTSMTKEVKILKQT